jgi:hypothetical protein
MLWVGLATASLLLASRAPARAGIPTCAEAAMAPIKLADDKFTGNVAQYLVDLHDSKAAFDFCGGMLFQLKLSDMLRADLVERAKSGTGQVTDRHSNLGPLAVDQLIPCSRSVSPKSSTPAKAA